ncbi:MAG: Ferric enterobactin transport ATP-binding protein FepC [Planctomycetes bacterium]|nr:Ferric enterobactin transport ATP-binding protein FepC [Planctomycetota bacterium]
MRLRADDLRFSYGRRPILDGVSIDVAEGQLLGLVGPNGAGKSTLLRCLCGMLNPSSGRATLDGRDVAAMSRRDVARVLGVVPQQCVPTFPVSVEEFVAMGRYARERFVGGPTPDDREVVARVLDEMGLREFARRPVDELSGGEFRRVLVGQALAQEPSLLLFDEPVQQLDLLHVLEVMGFARSFAKRPGCAAVVVLHDLGLAARYCDRVALLHQGRILAVGAPDEVLTEENVRTAYRVRVSVSRCPATGSIQVVPLEAA